MSTFSNLRARQTSQFNRRRATAYTNLAPTLAHPLVISAKVLGLA
ncbi:MAG: hypothetical protein ACPHJ3_16755 [Rubripirellula sp.]